MRTDKALLSKHTPSAFATNTTAYLLTMNFMASITYYLHRPDLSHTNLVVTSPHHRKILEVVVPLREDRRLLFMNFQR
jgi:hypothetical protein